MHRFKIWLKRVVILVALIGLLGLITKLFGAESAVTKFVKDKVVFTPFNFVGMVMVILASFGIWVGKKGGGKLLATVKNIASILSIASFIMGFASILGISNNLGAGIWKTIQKTTMIIGFISIILVIIFVIEKIIVKVKTNTKGTYNNNLDLGGMLKSRVESHGTNLTYEKDDEKGMSINEIERNENDEKKIINNENAKPISEICLVQKTKEDYEYDIANRICPICGGRLKSRQNHESGKWFMGCENYFTSVNCEFTMDYHKYKMVQNHFQHKFC